MSALKSNPRLAQTKPFSAQSVHLYKISAGVSYAALLTSALYYGFTQLVGRHAPDHRLWQHQPSLLFDQNAMITSAYWYCTLRC